MIFTDKGNEIYCSDWCDLTQDTIDLGVMHKDMLDLKWRFQANAVFFNCNHMRTVANKLADLNCTKVNDSRGSKGAK